MTESKVSKPSPADDSLQELPVAESQILSQTDRLIEPSSNPALLFREDAMTRCEICGNQYDKSFTIMASDGTQHVFDSFECAIHALAPRCAHCGCTIIGHGMETAQGFFCCAHCAEQMGVPEMQDRA